MKIKTEDIKFIHQKYIRGEIINILDDVSSINKTNKPIIKGGSNLIIDYTISKKDILVSSYLENMEKLFEENFFKKIFLNEEEINLFFKKFEKIKNYCLNREEILNHNEEIKLIFNNFYKVIIGKNSKIKKIIEEIKEKEKLEEEKKLKEEKYQEEERKYKEEEKRKYQEEEERKYQEEKRKLKKLKRKKNDEKSHMELLKKLKLKEERIEERIEKRKLKKLKRKKIQQENIEIKKKLKEKLKNEKNEKIKLKKLENEKNEKIKLKKLKEIEQLQKKRDNINLQNQQKNFFASEETKYHEEETKYEEKKNYEERNHKNKKNFFQKLLKKIFKK